jgi:hypothetical protein
VRAQSAFSKRVCVIGDACACCALPQLTAASTALY